MFKIALTQTHLTTLQILIIYERYLIYYLFNYKVVLMIKTLSVKKSHNIS